MNLPRFSVHRPVFTTMVTLIVMVLGGVALWRLPIDLLPQIDLPSLTITTTYENASPEEMERLVTEVIEEAVAAVPGVEEITSSSSEGQSSVTVSFTWGTDVDVAANDVRDRLDRVANALPDDADRPQLRKFDPAAFPILMLGVSSGLDPIEMTQLIENDVNYRLERIPGVAAVEVWGGFEREIQVNLDPQKIKALGLPLNTILEAIRSANVNVPAGEIERGNMELTLRIPGELTSLDQLRRTVIAVRQDAPVRLDQVASVDDTYRKLTRLVRINGERGVRVAVRKQSDANTVAVARDVLKEVEALNAELPMLRIVPVLNSATYIQRSIDNVTDSIFFGGSLAVLVLLVFLRNIRSTLVISLAIPISIIATFTLVYFAGYTLNLMTLGGLALGVGMMVDNAIVVLENIYRRRTELGENHEEAAVRGAGEVGAAVVASTVTTLVIFLPLIFVQGTAGILFAQLAAVITFSLICSLMVALSLVPMLAARLVRSSGEMASHRSSWNRRLADFLGAGLQRMDDAYRDFISTILRWRVTTVLVSLLLFGLSLLLIPLLGTEFLPPTDEGEVRVTVELESGTRMDVVDRRAREVEAMVLQAAPETEAYISSIGPSPWRASGASSADIRLALRPRAQRERSNEEVADAIRQALRGQVAGAVVRVRAPQGLMQLNRLVGDGGLGVEVRGFDLAVLDQLAAAVRDAVQDVPGVTDVRLSREAGVPQALFRIDRDKAADLGLTVQQVAQTLETAVAGSSAGNYRKEGDEFRILVRLADAERRSLEEILDLTIANSRGDAVLLRNLVQTEQGLGPIVVDRRDQQRVNLITLNLAGRDMGSVAKDVLEHLHDIPRPAGYEFGLVGNYEEQQEAFGELVISLVLSLVLVYMVLACLYESLRDPVVVMFSVPLAAIGVVLVLFLTDTTLNVQSFIGCVMLGGIVVNNAILIVDQAGQLRQQGMAVREAVAEAGRRRLRPILMTTLTTVLGLLPLALGIGEGAEAQAPLARAVIGGLSVSTLITLGLIPAVYSLFHPERSRT